jgi:DNA polymerase IV
MGDSTAQIAAAGESAAKSSPSLPRLQLKDFPPIFVLPIHQSGEQLQAIEDQVAGMGGTITHDISEAKLILGSVRTGRRARFELQVRRLRTEPVEHPLSRESPVTTSRGEVDEPPARKRQRLSLDVGDRSPSPVADDAGLESPQLVADEEGGGGDDDDDDGPEKQMSQLSMNETTAGAAVPSPDLAELVEGPHPISTSEPGAQVKVLALEWLEDSLKEGRSQPCEPYLVYEGKVLPDAAEAVPPVAISPTAGTMPSKQTGQKSALAEENASLAATETGRAEANPQRRFSRRKDRGPNLARGEFVDSSFASSSQHPGHRAFSSAPRAHLFRETTPEHDEAAAGDLPEMPAWVKENKIYACERSTPPKSPNDDFIALLKRIKLARVLIGDAIGVRAYSTSIASLAAYPYRLSSFQEVLALPGCDEKIASLFSEFHDSGTIQAVEDFESDPVMRVLRLFYDIHGVGATTAREFYHDRHWRTIDDIIDHGWNGLIRVQQIGVKFFEEFQIPIPRLETEFISSVVTYHAKQLVDDGIETIVVGSYRRGKEESGDVDMIISHRREAATKHLIRPLVDALETAGWITHTLTLAETNSARDQQPLPLRGSAEPGRGFDTLDKALVVWQDPIWPTRESDLAADPDAKNPNLHRRVDIIISPWRTVGCAVAGWTSGTTFQRDLRRYVKHVKGWKFDSSGIRERATGKWVDLERGAKTWQEAERKVFEGLGLEYREPWERCTG